VNRRRFIDQVRQYTSITKRNAFSYKETVNGLVEMYLQGVAESGASEAEQLKETNWAFDFVKREYAPFDRDYTLPDVG
jgi:hypothetical protein